MKSAGFTIYFSLVCGIEAFSKLLCSTNNSESQRNLVSGPHISPVFQGKLTFACIFSFFVWPENTCENVLFQTLNMSCSELRRRTKYQHLAGQLLLSVSDKTHCQRFSRTLMTEKKQAKKKNHQSPLIPSLKYTRKMYKS